MTLPKTQADLEKGEILVSPQMNGGDFAFVTQSIHHSVFADEPLDVGGTDTGFSSFDLLAASLAACTAITLRFYAKHKGILLGDFQVKISQESSLDPQSGEKIFHMTRHLYFPGVDDTKLLEKFKEIAEKCPIHRTLQGKIIIDTEIVE